MGIPLHLYTFMVPKKHLPEMEKLRKVNRILLFTLAIFALF